MRRSALYLLATTALAACGGDSIGPPGPPAVASVTVSPDSATVILYDTLTLRAIVRDAAGNVLTGRTVTWASSAPPMVSVQSTGTVEANSRGSAVITATSEGKSGTAKTVVLAPVVVIQVTPSNATLAVGDTLRLHATLWSSDGGPPTDSTVTWVSSDTTKATVSASGLVLARYAGTVPITATAGGKTAHADIVVPTPIATIVVSPGADTLTSGSSVQLSVEIEDSAGSPLVGRVVTWSSSDTSVVGVTILGLITGRAVGTAHIRASAEGKSDSAAIIVYWPSVAVVALSPDTGRVVIPGTLSLHAQPLDSVGRPLPRMVTWLVSDTAVAVVSPISGDTVTLAGHASGSVTVTATSDGQVASGAFSVVRPSVAEVVVSPDSGTIFVSPPLDSPFPVVQGLSAIARDSVGDPLADRVIHWVVADTTIASLLGGADGATTDVLGRAAGAARVIASTEGRADTAVVHVVRPSVASVHASPDTGSILVPNSYLVSAAAYDSLGRQLPRSIHWALADTAIAALNDTNGDYIYVTGRLAGTESVVASSEGVSDTALVKVIRQSVAAVVVQGDTGRLLHHVIRRFTAWAVDSVGGVLVGRPITWTSSDPTIAKADSVFTANGYAAGQVEGTGVGTATVSVSSEGKSEAWIARVYAVHYDRIATGQARGCALASDDSMTYCWGQGGPPGAVGGAPRLNWITSGRLHQCGITAAGTAYCWGANGDGQLGDGGGFGSDSARLVLGGYSFLQVSAGLGHTCGVTTSLAALCWGNGSTGDLGTGDFSSHDTPASVIGGLSFLSVSAGSGFTCGIVSDSSAYCWGSNSLGQLGIGSTGPYVTSPTVVGGAITFSTINTGADHSCGLTASGTAYCWGNNTSGQLGTGDNVAHYTPKPVAGGLVFQSISAGWYFTCGVTTLGQSYCWGTNNSYQLGNGGQSDANAPTPVAGGLSAQSVSAGANTACAVGSAGAYCWGLGPLGSFTGVSTIPIPVWGQP